MAQILTLTGSNFVSNSTVQVNGAPIATTFISGTQLQAMIPAADLAEEGNLAVSVLNPGSMSQTSNVLPFTVMDAPLSAAGTLLYTTEGTAVAGPVATFSDANPNGSINDYQATITWGDGASSSGTISANDSGGFTVSGSHTYEEGTYPVSVQITDVGGATISASGTAFVGDAALTAATVPVNATEGTAFAGAVATFTDANPNASAADFTATITWAPDQTSAGTITANPDGSFSVTGTYTYAEEGTYPLSVVITDRGGAAAQVAGSAIVVDAPLTATGATVSATQGVDFNGVLASFTDANPNATASEFTATILWGDGATSAGTIAANADGSFAVTGEHTYTTEGSYPLAISILDQGGSTATAYGLAQVQDSIPTVNAWLFRGRNRQRVYLLAHFTDMELEHHTVRIDWGDGTVTRARLGTSSEGFLFRTHWYSEHFVEHHPNGTHIVVTVADDDGTTSDPEVLAVEFHRHHHG